MSETSASDPRAKYWQDQVEACKHSGLSKAQYCRDNDLAYHVLIYWSTKLSGREVERKKTEQGLRGKLIPVTLSSLSNGDNGLQLRLPNGVYVSGINAQSVDLLGRVIDQL